MGIGEPDREGHGKVYPIILYREILTKYSKTASVPKITSSLALKTYKALARPYDALAAAFTSGKWERLRDEAEAGQMIWSDVSLIYLIDILYVWRVDMVLRI